MNLKFILLIFTLFLSTAVCLSQSKKELQFAKEYAEAAIWDADGLKVPLMKWIDKEKIRYYVYGELMYLTEKPWSKFITQIENITNLNFVEAKSPDDANILIYYGSLADYFNELGIKIPGNLSNEFGSWSNRTFTKYYQLKKASFCIDPQKVKKFKYGTYLMQSLFLKSIGLLGNIDNEYSIFNHGHSQYNSSLSKLDKRFIMLHYNDQIKTGLTEVEDFVLKHISISNILKENFK